MGGSEEFELQVKAWLIISSDMQSNTPRKAGRQKWQASGLFLHYRRAGLNREPLVGHQQ